MIKRKRTLYELFIKRIFDFTSSLLAILILSPFFIIISILVKIQLGGPIIFKQKRPGKNNELFTMYKFRSMTNKKDEKGNLLPDEERRTKFGEFLRKSSLDELPGLFNILFGHTSLVGPRPHLPIDLHFMSEEQKARHSVRPGLTGLAQVNGRNGLTWDEKFYYDLKYVEKVTFFRDLKIIFKTIFTIFKKEGINTETEALDKNLGSYMLYTNRISEYEYYNKIASFDLVNIKKDN